MKNKIFIFLMIFAVCMAQAFIAPCAGAAETQTPAGAEKLTVPENGPGQPKNLPPDTAVRAVESQLSPEALETYAYLLLIQAILDEDEAALLDIAPDLIKSSASPDIWQDGGLWLASRKSANTVPYMEQALKVWPDDLSLNLLYAEALGEHGMPGKGVELMRSFLEKHPDNLEARLELALLLVKDKQFDEAQKLLAGIAAKERTFLVDYYQAKALLGMDKRQEALTYLRRATKGMPDFVEGIAELAVVLEQDGNLKEARSTYEKLQKLQFSPQDVTLKLVNLSLKLKQPEKALQYIKKGPDTLSFKLTAANMFLQAHHYLQAENILKQVATRPDAPVEVYLMLADIVYEQRRNLNMALSWLDKIPQDKPGLEKADLLRMQLLTEAGKTGQALSVAEKAVKRFPDMPELEDFRIRLLARQKKTEQALELAREAVKKWPANIQLEFLLGSLLDDAGNKSAAMKVMENIVSHDPDNFQALNYVGFTLAEEKRDLDRALQMLTKANELSPDQSYIVDSLAWALFQSGRLEEALKEIRRAIKLGDSSNDPAVWEHYGDIANKNGHKEEARKAYRKAIELKPANVTAIRNKLSRI